MLWAVLRDHAHSVACSNCAYHAACARITRTYDGLAEFRGDGILAYFGYPKAHEDDAERTVRAGLDIAGL